MQITELQQTIEQLPIEQRLRLLSTIAQSVQRDLMPPIPIDKLAIINQLRGCLKQPNSPTPSDADIKAIREARLTEKYL
jgi:hypothetical protein